MVLGIALVASAAILRPILGFRGGGTHSAVHKGILEDPRMAAIDIAVASAVAAAIVAIAFAASVIDTVAVAFCCCCN